MKRRLVAYSSSLALLLGGSIAVTPGITHADGPDPAYTVSACAAGTAPTLLSNLYLQLTGAANDAAPAATIVTTSPINPGVIYINSPSGFMPSTTAISTTGFSSSSPQEFGYVAFAQGVSTAFQAGTQNARGALFTFTSTAASVQDLTPSFQAFSVRSGSISFYAATGLAGDFTNSSSFSSGTAILTAHFTQTIAANPGNIPGVAFSIANLSYFSNPSQVGPYFTATSTNTITSVTPFSIGGTCYQLGSVGQSFTRTDVGHLAGFNTLFGSFQGVTRNT